MRNTAHAATFFAYEPLQSSHVQSYTIYYAVSSPANIHDDLNSVKKTDKNNIEN